MIAIDTNVLLRVLVDDPDAPEQCRHAREVLIGAGKARIAAIVFAEAIWVLHKSYKASRTEVARIANEVLNHSRYSVDNESLLKSALEIFAASNVDFSDAIALADARQASLPLHTFDRKLARLEGAVAC